MAKERVARIAFAASVACATLAGAPRARADEMVFGPNDVPTVFFINKSDDRNRVDYGIRLDATCGPVNDDALVLYWRVFENAPPVRTKPLSLLDRIPYGVAEQRRLRRTSSGTEYAVRLKQFDRPIVILTRREPGGRCSATARSTVSGVGAELLSVYAKLAGLFSVEYIDIFGKNLETGAEITERIKK